MLPATGWSESPGAPLSAAGAMPGVRSSSAPVIFLDSLSSLRKEQLCGGGERRIQKWVKWKRAKILQIYKEQQTLISLRKVGAFTCKHSPGRSVRGNGNCAPLCRFFFVI